MKKITPGNSEFRTKNLKQIYSSVTEKYKNLVIEKCNDSCLRMSVNNGVYSWHHHPNSDELFIVIEGELNIELSDSRVFELKQWDYLKIPKGVVHRTFSNFRTVNLTYELQDLKTIFLSEVEREKGYYNFEVKNLKQIGDSIQKRYENVELETINNDVIRLEVNNGIYDWYHHPDCEELFLVVDGNLRLESEDLFKTNLRPLDLLLIPKKMEHSTMVIGRKVSVTFENRFVKSTQKQ